MIGLIFDIENNLNLDDDDDGKSEKDDSILEFVLPCFKFAFNPAVFAFLVIFNVLNSLAFKLKQHCRLSIVDCRLSIVDLKLNISFLKICNK